ncbi:MarR family transcriptional regulator [Pseudonocardia eucalypti]|uniref:MarR family transcriptional regulator n=1 Tax=Pseudonocardia eucalypti TaxID=648755 RepID=A0ABP9RAV1_9PSEU|nr:DNA-binding MarR family transcriptional regulator [Pseudonocardia eucalypti]
MSAEQDPIEFTREHWADQDQPGAEYFAAMGALMRTHQLMINELDRELKAHNLSRTAFLLMATLLISREHTRPLGQLSRHLLVHPTTITLVVDQLAARELVHRRPHPTDRRTVLATLTEEGLRAVTKAAESLAAARFGLTSVNEPLARRLSAVLGEVRTKMDDAP